MASIQRPTRNYVTQGKHGRYNAVDFAGRSSRYIPVMNRRNIYSPEDGKVTAYGPSGTCGNRLEITSKDKKRRHGMCHLSARKVRVGATVKRGQLVGVMGYSGYTRPSGYFGTHLHWVIRVGSKYVYPLTLVNKTFRIWKPAPPKPKYKMPKLGSKIKLTPGVRRTTYKAGTTRKAGRIWARNNSYIYTVRGYDKKYPNRILINSKSGGGKGVALALYFTNGKIIPGWKKV